MLLKLMFRKTPLLLLAVVSLSGLFVLVWRYTSGSSRLYQGEGWSCRYPAS